MALKCSPGRGISLNSFVHHGRGRQPLEYKILTIKTSLLPPIGCKFKPISLMNDSYMSIYIKKLETKIVLTIK